MGPPGGPIFGTVFRFIFAKFFAPGLKKRNVLVSTETLWLMATGKATREALLSEAGFEKVFRTQNWVRRSKLFCRWFCSLLGQAGCISVAAWTRWKLASYYLVSSGGLIVCCWKKAPADTQVQASASAPPGLSEIAVVTVLNLELKTQLLWVKGPIAQTVRRLRTTVCRVRRTVRRNKWMMIELSSWRLQRSSLWTQSPWSYTASAQKGSWTAAGVFHHI